MLSRSWSEEDLDPNYHFYLFILIRNNPEKVIVATDVTRGGQWFGHMVLVIWYLLINAALFKHLTFSLEINWISSIAHNGNPLGM